VSEIANRKSKIMRFLVTAGPTREPIDPVRFLSNRSSGKMGYAVAASARERGHEVVLISGPVALEPVAGVEVIFVSTAEEMCAAVTGRIEWCDVLVMAAAVADWRPVGVRAQKIKKRESMSALPLERTPDILKRVAARKGDRIFIGFAAETENVVEEARRKLREKNLDLIVANDVSRLDAGFDVDTNAVTLIPAAGAPENLPLQPKSEIARRVVEWAESRGGSFPRGDKKDDRNG
jgi:phosphopantothenoylcysteine decarboxylase / phosphopantothenate---cysteine ligase